MMEPKSRWHMHRLGMLDFWYYNEQEFYFDHGHMLLRGSNGSGKSVTLQSFLPLLLDGNKSSERLDTFGTRSRRMETYLLEEDGDRDDRIGYLYLEFKREESEVYKTIGMGLHARRGKPLDSWYFVIEDQRRIGIDLRLMEDGLTITRQVLKNQIGDQLYTSQREYCEKVNQALFGFERIEDYLEAIDLILQLRSPKLSNSLRPSAINEILNASLRPLSEEDLRPMSEAIANMDALKDQLDALKASRQAASVILQVYEHYARALLQEKASLYRKALGQEQECRQQLEMLERTIADDDEQLVQNRKQQQEKQQSLELLQAEAADLENSDQLRMVEEQQRLHQEMGKQTDALARKQEQLRSKQEQQIRAREEHRKQQHQYEDLCHAIDRQRKEMETLAADLHFEEHALFMKELKERFGQELDLSYTAQQLKEHMHHLREGIQQLQEHQAQQQVLIQLEDRYAQALDEVRLQEQQQKKAETAYDEELEDMQDAFSRWLASLQEMKLPSDGDRTIARELQNYETKENFLQTEDMVKRAYQQQLQRLLEMQGAWEAQKTALHAQLDACDQQLYAWKNRRDPSPVLEDGQVEARRYLQEKDIPNRPLYLFLEYGDEVSGPLRDRFEEILERSGWLNALLIHQCHRMAVSEKPAGSFDNYLFVDKEPASIESWELRGANMQELSASFQLFLHSIGAEGSRMQMTENSFSLDVLHATLATTKRSRFIGTKAREAYRLQRIEEIEAERASLYQQEQMVCASIDEGNQRLERLQAEANALPKEAELKNSLHAWQQAQRSLLAKEQFSREAKERVTWQQGQMAVVWMRIEAIAKELQLSAQLDIFEAYEGTLEAYQECFDALRRLYPQMLHRQELAVHTEDSLYQLEGDVRLLEEEQASLQKMLDRLQKRSASIEEQLQTMGAQALTERLRQISERLQQLPKEINDCYEKIGFLRSALKKADEQKKQLQQEHQQHQEETHRYAEVLAQELQNSPLSLPEWQEATMLATVDAVLRSDPVSKRSDLLKGEVQSQYYAQRGSLQEYQLTMGEDARFSEVEGVLPRLMLHARYRGKQITFHELAMQLDQDIDAQKRLLEDSDRHLFEDILVNIISKQIRLRIQDSQHWVMTMNRYMEAMTASSSSLRLSLRWMPKKAESEQELDTRELIALLQKDVGLLKDSDLKRLSAHFRSKIDTARQLLDQQENQQSFHQLMRTVMDYRQWFEFRIMTQKNNENRKELTNHLFYSYSGGEKAMSMYVPLFSAMAAKMAGTRKDAPLLIALDEAFAGVDDKNISIMFDLIERFGFDYIMNSQVLWGDYPTVRHLAIYELFRPENAHYVTVIPYAWNGRKRRLKER